MWMNLMLTLDECHELIPALNKHLERDETRMSVESARYTERLVQAVDAMHSRLCNADDCPETPIPFVLSESYSLHALADRVYSSLTAENTRKR